MFSFVFGRHVFCNCRLSSNSPIGKVELLNQSGPLNHKLHLCSLDGGIPLVPQSAGFSRPLHKVPVHVSQLLNLCHSISYERLPSSGSDFNHASVILNQTTQRSRRLTQLEKGSL
ncbi:hypothetical protein TNCV_4413421 [Trichonephila clavipes]|nr:hypothetical protein TNCV_4413421 [Trichonephila clavipes]